MHSPRLPSPHRLGRTDRACRGVALASRGAAALEWVMLAGAAVLVCLPFACWRRDPGDQTVLRLWAGGTPEEGAMFAEAVRAFEALHPDVKVKLETPGGSRLDKYLAAMQAGSCADVVWVHWRDMPALAAKKVLLPLNDLCRRDGYDLDERLLRTLANDVYSAISEEGQI